MATVEYTILAPNSGRALPAATTLAAGVNPVKVAEAQRSLLHRGGAEPENTILIVSGTGTLKVKAGEFPLALSRQYGDLSIPISGQTIVGPFESGRVMDNDGNIYLEGTGLSVIALLFPRNT